MSAGTNRWPHRKIAADRRNAPWITHSGLEAVATRAVPGCTKHTLPVI
jgi:hypothetical protein